MVEETIRSVRETEEKAADIVKEAEEKGRKMIESAQEQAKQQRESILAEAKKRAGEMQDAAERSGESDAEKEYAETERVIRKMKEKASGKIPGAVDKMVSMLV